MLATSALEPPSAGRRLLSAATLGVACAVGACGAKTPLEVPDAGLFADGSDVAMPPPVCVEPRTGDGLYTVGLQTTATHGMVDVFFLVDRTGSMGDEIDNIRTTLNTLIAPGLARAIPDLGIGAATYADFPIDPYGHPSDEPFRVDQPVITEITPLQGALDRITVGGGGDGPEALTEALYQLATGGGLAPFVPMAPGCRRPGVGYACFRPRAQAVILVVTDAPTHNGPFANSHAYDSSSFSPGPAPHTYQQMLAALVPTLHPYVIGINSGTEPDSGRAGLVRLARDTGALAADGTELVFDIGPDGAGLGEQVVRSIERFESEVRFDASARAWDLAGTGPVGFVQGVRAGVATPATQVQRTDATTFYGVVPGTTLGFELVLDRSRLQPSAQEQRITVRVEFVADGRALLGHQDVVVVVPPRGQPCP